jgi:hypothetical protein
MSELVPVPAKPALPALTPDDRLLLQEIAIQGTLTAAAKALGITVHQARNRLDQPQVRVEFDRMFPQGDVVDATKREVILVSRKVADILEEAADAQIYRDVQAECPKCHHKFQVKVPNIAYATKVKAAEMLAKMTNLWEDRRTMKVEGGTTNLSVSVALPTLTTEEMLALGALQNGVRGVPPHMVQRLVQLSQGGQLFQVPNQGGPAIEGDYREIDSSQ